MKVDVNTCLTAVFVMMALLILGCTGETDFFEEKNSVTYLADKKIKLEDIVYGVRMKGSPDSDTLMMQITTENRGDQRKDLLLNRSELIGSNGVRSEVVEASRKKVTLLPGEKSIDSLFFTPVNHLELYQLSGLHGRFLKEYSFVPAALANVSTSSKGIGLKVNEEQYTEYIEKDPYSEVKVFGIEGSKAMEDTLSKSLKKLQGFYRKDDKREMSNVRISRKEILIGGYAILTRLYRRNGSLQLYWRMINHQGLPVSVDPRTFTIISGTKALKPGKVSLTEQPASWARKPGELQKGERVGARLIFGQTDADSLSLQVNVTFANGHILIKEIPLREVILTNQE